MTWAELVNHYNTLICKDAEKADNNYKREFLVEMLKSQEQLFNSESLARIATALEKIAGMDTEVKTDDYLEEQIGDS